jgi:beta-glucosidase
MWPLWPGYSSAHRPCAVNRALGWRDFEYSTGEDPYLGSQLVVPLVEAMQQQGVWANVKHFVCNDEEYRRENIDIEVDERALREIYLPPFEAAVTQGDAATVMAAFNSVNGAFCSQNPILDTHQLQIMLIRETGV